MSDKVYMDESVDEAIIDYNNINNEIKKKRLFNNIIYPALDKLVENVIHKWKFYSYDTTYNDRKDEMVSYLYTKLHKYDRDKGSAFSYFTIVCKNELIKRNNSNHDKRVMENDLMLIDVERDLTSEQSEQSHEEDLESFIIHWTDWCENHIGDIFLMDRDKLVANSVLELFRSADDIGIYNKKLLYILIRERTDISKTSYITKVVKKLEELFYGMYEQWKERGEVSAEDFK